MPTDRFPTAHLVRLLAALAIGLALSACQPADDEGGDATASPTRPPASTAPPTTVSERDQVAADLKEAIEVRDQAFATRDASLLDGIYSDECPCLDRDRRLIGEMRKQRVLWKTPKTTVTPTKVERVSDQRWTVIAKVQVTAYDIVTDDGELIRRDGADDSTALFALVISGDGRSWLLADIRRVGG